MGIDDFKANMDKTDCDESSTLALFDDNTNKMGGSFHVTTPSLSSPKATIHQTASSDPRSPSITQGDEPLINSRPSEMSILAKENGNFGELGIDLRRPPAKVARVNKQKKTNHVVKGQWNTKEDRLLKRLVGAYGMKRWALLAHVFKERTGKQCRERWHNHLRPDIKKDTWTEDEDRILIQSHMELGNRWAEIARRLPGRSENSIKNHWNATKRQQLSGRRPRRNGSSQATPSSSLLQEYIRSLNPPPPTTPAAPPAAADEVTPQQVENPSGHPDVPQKGTAMGSQEAGGGVGWQQPLFGCYDDPGDLADLLLHDRSFCRACGEAAGWLLENPAVVDPAVDERELLPPLSSQSEKREMDLVEMISQLGKFYNSSSSSGGSNSVGF